MAQESTNSRRGRRTSPPRIPRRPRVEILQQELVPRFIRHDQVVLLIHNGSATFNDNIVRHFHNGQRGAWWLGVINQAACPNGWAEKYVASLWPDGSVPLRPHVPEGYFLFLSGSAAAFHTGQCPVGPSGEPLFDHPLWLLGSAVVSTLANGSRDYFEGAKDAVELFEMTVHAPRTVDPPASARRTRDPYSVLGLERGALLTPDELTKAYHGVVAGTHPDPFAKKHPRLIELAHQLTREATDAYNAIRAERCWR